MHIPTHIWENLKLTLFFQTNIIEKNLLHMIKSIFIRYEYFYSLRVKYLVVQRGINKQSQ